MPRVFAAVLALCLLLAACGGDEDAAPGAEAGQATLMAGTTGLGDTLLDGSGRAVYLFDKDTGGTSSCAEQCATAWPPLIVQGVPVAGEGVDPAKLGTIERADGSMQVTYAGHPLYHFSGDENPGDIRGQGVNGVWWLLRPDGTPMPPSDVGMGY